MSHRPPSNSTRSSDERFWYLREVQDLFQMPLKTDFRAPQSTRVTDLTTGSHIVFGDIAPIPGYDAALALSVDGRALHVLQGNGPTQTAKIVLPESRSCCLCVNGESAFGDVSAVSHGRPAARPGRRNPGRVRSLLARWLSQRAAGAGVRHQSACHVPLLNPYRAI